MDKREKVEALFNKFNYTDYRWIDPREIVVSQWVRLKCVFGCAEYGRTATCPPNVPSFTECERFFQEYREAVVFHFEKRVAKPEDRFSWTKEVNSKLLQLEREVFISGLVKAFLLFMDSCCLCESCPGRKEKCKKPRLARPTPEAMAIDVYSTVRKAGYPIEVLYDYSQKMNRYAFLLIE